MEQVTHQFTDEAASKSGPRVNGECVTIWHTAGTGFMDPGFGHVHRAVSRDDAYTTFVLPTGSPSQTIPRIRRKPVRNRQTGPGARPLGLSLP